MRPSVKPIRVVVPRVMSPTFDSSIEGTGVPVLDAVATRSGDGSRLFVRAVNTSRVRALTVTLTVTGTPARRRWDVADGDGRFIRGREQFPNAAGGYGEDAVDPEQRRVHGGPSAALSVGADVAERLD